jgi:1-acyl-sn-glycerol-3-phosphate acyltransferase
LQPFKGGIVKILDRARADGLDVPVVPMALTNLWGSYFSRIEQGGAMVRPFRRGLFNRVGLNVGTPVAAAEAQPELLRERVARLLAACLIPQSSSTKAGLLSRGSPMTISQ